MNVNAVFTDSSFDLFEVDRRAGTIGADPALRQGIEDAFMRLGRAREACFGDAAYLTATACFKRDFGIGKMQPWTVVWDWPACRADEILNYLEGRRAEAEGGL